MSEDRIDADLLYREGRINFSFCSLCGQDLSDVDGQTRIPLGFRTGRADVDLIGAMAGHYVHRECWNRLPVRDAVAQVALTYASLVNQRMTCCVKTDHTGVWVQVSDDVMFSHGVVHLPRSPMVVRRQLGDGAESFAARGRGANVLFLSDLLRSGRLGPGFRTSRPSVGVIPDIELPCGEFEADFLPLRIASGTGTTPKAKQFGMTLRAHVHVLDLEELSPQ